MRLIDADALPSALFQKHVHDEEELKPMLYFEDAVKVVENAPTIDAIPVEWLENRLNTLCFEAMGAGALYGDRIGELAKSINEVMKLWQKEQEAQDG